MKIETVTKYLTPELLDEATRRGNAIPAGIRNSITGGANRAHGALGELLVEAYLGDCSPPGSDVYDGDMLRLGKLLEVKTKIRAYRPQPDWAVHVAESSRHQRADILIFTSLLSRGLDRKEINGRDCHVRVGGIFRWNRPHGAFIVGWMDREEFYGRADEVKAGDIWAAESGDKNAKAELVDCWKLPNSALRPASDMLLQRAENKSAQSIDAAIDGC